MKLNIKASSEKGKVKSVSSDEYINIDIAVGNRQVGAIELQILTQDYEDDSVDEVEWLLKYYINPAKDPLILRQGHLPKGTKQQGECISHEWNYLGEGDEPTARQCKLCGYTEKY